MSLQDPVPHHSSLSRIKKRLGVGTIENFFLEIIRQCNKANLVKSTSVMTDSTLLDANASLDSLILKSNQHGLASEKSKQVSSNKTHISRTDPDATLAFKSGAPRTLKYKAHVTSDNINHIILAIKVTTVATHDSVPYLEQLNYVEKNIGKIKETIADRAYGSGEIITKLRSQGLITYIPLFSSRSGSSENSNVPGFQYDTLKNQYLCPQQHPLKPCNSESDTTMYISSSLNCKTCDFAGHCAAKKKNKGPIRYLTRNKYAERHRLMKEEMEQQHFKDKLYERMWRIEGGHE